MKRKKKKKKQQCTHLTSGQVTNSIQKLRGVSLCTPPKTTDAALDLMHGSAYLYTSAIPAFLTLAIRPNIYILYIHIYLP